MKIFLSLIAIILIIMTPACIRKPHCNCFNTKSKILLPAFSFVKIHKTMNVLKCKKNIKDSPCVVGKYIIQGSGVAIKNTDGGTLVLSAAHVCDLTPPEVLVKTAEKWNVSLTALNLYGVSKPAKTVSATFAKNDLTDLCLLFSKDLQTTAVGLARRNPEVGDQVISINSPMGIFHPPTVPILSGIYSGPVNQVNDMVTIPSIGGSSGGAVFNQEMKLVGIVFASVRKFPHITLVSSLTTTRKFLRMALSEFRQNKKKFTQ